MLTTARVPFEVLTTLIQHEYPACNVTFDNGYSSGTSIHPPTPITLMNIRRHVQHVNNGNVFRNVNEILVRNVNTPPHPRAPPDEHTTACATC